MELLEFSGGEKNAVMKLKKFRGLLRCCCRWGTIPISVAELPSGVSGGARKNILIKSKRQFSPRSVPIADKTTDEILLFGHYPFEWKPFVQI